MERELVHTRALLSHLFKSRSAPSPLSRAVERLSLDSLNSYDAGEVRDATDSSEDESSGVANSVTSSAASDEEKCAFL